MFCRLLPIVGAMKIFHIPEKNPPFVQIAVTNLCNKNCGMCIRFQVPIEFRHMDYGDFKRIVDRLQGVESITLVGMGEPLLYPHLMEAICYCKEKGIKTRITTNGVLLREKARELVEAGLDIIHLSVENVRQKEFLEDILELKRIRDENGAEIPEIVLQPILFGNSDEGGRTVQDVYDVISWGGENSIDRVNIARVDLRTDPTMKRPSVVQEKEIFKELAQLRKEYSMRIDCLQDQVYSGLKGWVYKHFKFLLRLNSWCYRFGDYVYIDVNGNVHPCPIDMDQIMGNVFEQSLYDIWHGERYNHLRKHQEEYSFCRRCDFLKLKQVDPI
jgi:MoaA/NifB/PqqE/SkfB family radical SAM enzyme